MPRYQDEDLEDEFETTSNPGVFARTATILVLALLAIAVYLYMAADKGTKEPNALPLITENHPLQKVKPDNPGGMQIPNQDASVYDHLDKGTAAAEPEKLMPTAEAPVANIAASTPPSTPASIPNALPSLPAAPATKTTAAAPPPAAPAADTTAAALAKIVQQAAADQASPAPVDDAAVRLQLGAVSNQAAAEAEWMRVKSQYPDELKGLDSHFSPVDLGNKGSFVRIQTDAIAEADAKARCQKLKLTGQACLVVKAAP